MNSSMALSSPFQPRSRPGGFKIFVLVVLLAAGVAALPALRDIPWTKHAAEKHAAQAWNTVTIYNQLTNRQCQPILTYACTDTVKVICPVGEDLSDLWIGMVIGTASTQPVIVTAYAAPASYWHANVAGCVPVSYVP